MAHLLLRSPQFKSYSYTGANSGKLELYVDPPTNSIGTTLVYTLTKEAIDERVTFDISELARDYIEHSMPGTSFDRVLIKSVISMYSSTDASGTALSTDTSLDAGYDGYGDFEDGVNPETSYDTEPKMGNTTIFAPEDTAAYFTTLYGTYGPAEIVSTRPDGYTWTQGSTTMTLRRVCDPKHTPYAIWFINKWGLRQQLWFFHKSVEGINVTSENYKANLFEFADTDYDTTKHQYQTFNVGAKGTIQLNTAYVTEDHNETIKQLLLSEYVWIYKDSSYIPVKPKTQSLQYKTKVNDKLIQYTLDFEYAFDLINNVR